MPPIEPNDEGFAEGETTEAAIPGFQTGGRVERTGIALVHEGEYIVPASGSEAVLAPNGGHSPGSSVINYYFPVEIEIVGTLSDEQVQRIADHVFGELESELASRL